MTRTLPHSGLCARSKFLWNLWINVPLDGTVLDPPLAFGTSVKQIYSTSIMQTVTNWEAIRHSVTHWWNDLPDDVVFSAKFSTTLYDLSCVNIINCFVCNLSTFVYYVNVLCGCNSCTPCMEEWHCHILEFKQQNTPCKIFCWESKKKNFFKFLSEYSIQWKSVCVLQS